jgi:hypothetical protein
MICSAFNNCVNANSKYEFKINFINDNNRSINLNIRATSINITSDLIIGRPTIKAQKLFTEHFSSQISIEPTHTQGCVACQTCNSMTVRRDWNSARHLSATYYSKPEYLAMMLHQKKSENSEGNTIKLSSTNSTEEDWDDKYDTTNGFASIITRGTK